MYLLRHPDQYPHHLPSARYDPAESDRLAEFLDHVDETTIAEPAVFPEVIAAGLQSGSYAPNQADASAKPEILLPGEGPISFRLPSLTAMVARWLSLDPGLDVAAVKARLLSVPVLNR